MGDMCEYCCWCQKIVGKGFDPLLSKQSLVCFRYTNLQYSHPSSCKLQTSNFKHLKQLAVVDYLKMATISLSINLPIDYDYKAPLNLHFENRNQNIQFKRKMKVFIILASTLLILTTAFTCSQASVPNPSNICITPNFIEGCSQYLNDHQCATCNYRYALQPNGLCQLNTNTNQDCCKVRAADKKCITCQTGLYLIAGKCTESNILGCLEKDTNGVCTNCAADFILKDGVCSKAVRNCNKYKDPKNIICIECKVEYSLTNNICVRNQILGCKLQEGGICKQCFKPFLLQKDRCIVQNCQTYNQYKCVACQCGYYLDSDGSCKKIDYGCIRYNRAVCVDCLPGFRLKGNHCQMEGCLKTIGLRCEACEQSYEVINGICKMKNCQEWKEGSCQICKAGFNYRQGKCVGGIILASE